MHAGGQRHYHLRNPQAVVERGAARVDPQLQRSRQDSLQEKLPCRTREGTHATLRVMTAFLRLKLYLQNR